MLSLMTKKNDLRVYDRGRGRGKNRVKIVGQFYIL